jgi:hypothetical protein
MTRVSKPMKLITLRIDPEEKARLDQLAEVGDVTLSRALREGAALYLTDLQGKMGRARGKDVTWHGIRRDANGVPRNPTSLPTSRQKELIESLRAKLHQGGLQPIKEAWSAGCGARVALAGLAQWLSVVGELYAGSAGEIGWSWFLRDYGGTFAGTEEASVLRRELRAAVMREATVSVDAAIDALDSAFQRLLIDIETQNLVRRAVLPAWEILEKELGA